MYTLQAYRKLPKEIKSIATKYYVSVACMRMNVSHHNHLYDFFELERSYNPQLPALPTSKGNFWTLKSGGEVIDRTHIIEAMDKYLPDLSMSTLRHPIWQAFALKVDDTSSASILLRLLNPELSSKIFYEEAYSQRVQQNEISKELIEHISKHCSLDSAAALLVFHDLYEEHADLVIELLIKTIITLSMCTPTDVIGFDLYELMFERTGILKKISSHQKKVRKTESFSSWIIFIKSKLNHMLGKEVYGFERAEIFTVLSSINLEELNNYKNESQTKQSV
ncbi:hypothetical protein [Kangiella sp. TOML190]|uniref:hypothetical protein n=1 Tax=Kangiella sp. TOML190 TaxID=2931351 RepID=UPI00203C9632|nr:hypothetical protein [Kangiella sp. TOML190]